MLLINDDAVADDVVNDRWCWWLMLLMLNNVNTEVNDINVDTVVVNDKCCWWWY